MILEILWKVLAIVDALFETGMCDVSGNNDSSVKAQTRRNRVLCKFLENLRHREVEVNLHCVALTCFTEFLRDETSRIVVKLLNPDTVLVDLRLDVTVSRAAYAETDRAACTMTRKPYDTDVVSEIFSAEPRPIL